MSDLLTELLQQKPFLLADGAMGTNLFEVGLQTGDAPELWNVDQPEKIATLCRQFIDAGSDIVLSNTFGGNRYRLKLHNAADRVRELNAAAVDIVKEQIADIDRPIVIGGSIGPTGEILQPTGTLSMEDAVAAFTEQAEALKEAGADVLWLETFSAVEEVQAALLAAAAVNMPSVYTMSIDTNGRTMMGVTPKELIHIADDMANTPRGCGTNCGVGASEVIAAIINMSNALNDSNSNSVLVAKANCGIPEYVDGKIVYNGTPELMAKYATMAVDVGARIIGGCCGTTPNHVKAMREALDSYVASGNRPGVEQIEKELGEVSKGASAQMMGDLSVAGGSASNGGERLGRRRRRIRR